MNTFINVHLHSVKYQQTHADIARHTLTRNSNLAVRLVYNFKDKLTRPTQGQELHHQDQGQGQGRGLTSLEITNISFIFRLL